MISNRISPIVVRLLGASALATVLAIAPVGLTTHGPADSVAFAKGGGDGGGGHGGGDRGGGDKGASADRDGGRGDRGNGGPGRGADIASRGHDANVSVASLSRDASRRDDDRRDGRHGHNDRDFRGGGLGLGAGLGRGVGFGNVPVDPARIEARAAALDARGDRRAAEIRSNADRVAASIISRAEARAADLRAREATAKNPAALEARAVSIIERANVAAAAVIAKAESRAAALTARVDDRVETIQAIAAYDRAVIAALALNDPIAQSNAIAAARSDLRASIDRPVSGRAIDRLDDRLNLDGTPSAIASRSTGVDG